MFFVRISAPLELIEEEGADFRNVAQRGCGEWKTVWVGPRISLGNMDFEPLVGVNKGFI